MAWYRQGTASVANGATAVSGALTGWTNQARAEDRISFDAGGTWYEIAAVNSNTSLTLATAFAQATVTNGAYAIDPSGRRWGQVTALAADVAALLASATHILQGSGAPAGSAGADGDIYVDTTNKYFYGPKAAGAWPAGFSLVGPAAGREVLTGNRTYYVRADGNNANNGLSNSAGGAFLTLQKALDVAAALDISVYAVTIQLGAGSYAGATVGGPWVGVGTVKILGDTTTPANVIITSTIGAQNKASLDVAGLKFTGAPSLYAALRGSIRIVGRVDFGSVGTGLHMSADSGDIYIATTAYTISGGAGRHMYMANGAKIQSSVGSITVTLAGTPAFPYSFVYAGSLSMGSFYSLAYSGGATGLRYYVESNAILNTYGGGASFFPGDSAGGSGSGGIYA